MDTLPYAIIEAPSNLGLSPSGVQHLSAALLRAGLAERLGAQKTERVEPPPFKAGLEPETGVLNARAIAAWSPKLADAVGAALDRGAFPVVLGGDCSILLGTTLALRRRGRYGLLFIDGHADFYQPDAEPKGEAASMDLALVTGHGPDLLINVEGRRPLVQSSDAVAFGFRDGKEQLRDGSQPLPNDLLAFDLATLGKLGIEAATEAALLHLTRPQLDGFFIHFDADCLHDSIMPAVDYRLPGGLTHAEAVAVLRAALATGKAVGIEVTIYNPNLDPDGAAGRTLADILAEALGTSVRQT